MAMVSLGSAPKAAASAAATSSPRFQAASATPPPEFDLDLAIASLRLFASRRPQALALAHFGVLEGDPGDVLGEAEDVLREWAGVAEAAWDRGDDVAGALAAAFGADPSESMAILNGVHSNAAGLRRWLDTRSGGSNPPIGG